MNRLPKSLRSIALAGGLIAGMGLWPSACTSAATTPSAEAAPASSPSYSVPPGLTQAMGTSIADVTERALPSVVSVLATKVTPARQLPFPFPFPFGPSPEQPPGEAHGLGSGVVVSADGVILTNNHVVEGAQDVRIVTNDDKEYAAKVVGTDPKSDLAVLRLVDTSVKLPPIAVGDSSKLRLGEVVLAIGNPFGVGQTVTMGIVSAKGRADVGITAYEDFIQTDAAINPGNSGGALINMRGELVGINTAILSRSGGNMGIGFAIPTEMATPIMHSLLKSGRVNRGFLGVSIQDVTPDLAAALKLSQPRGVLIADVQPGGPAARAGLLRGDVVLKVNGQAVDTTGRLRNAIAAAGAGNKVRLDILRAGAARVLEVELGELPADENASAAIGEPGAPARGSTLDGLTLENLNEAARRAFRVPKDVTRGVVVTRVAPGSPAARAGLRPGDVLLEVDRKPVDGVESFRRAWTAAKGKVALLVNRRGSTTFVVVNK